jgi:hypothetical protein
VYVEGLRGTEDHPITIGGAEGEERPVLSGGGEGLHLTRVAWLIVHDLEVEGAQNNGINIDDGGAVAEPGLSSHVVFRRIDVRDVGGTGNQDCLKISGVYDFLVVDSAFARCGGGMSGSGIDMVGAHRGLIARSRFASMAANAVQAKGGSADIEIYANHIVDGGGRAVNMGGSTGFEFFRPPLDPNAVNAEARRIRVVANVIERGDTPFGFVGCVDCAAVHNTIVDPQVWLLRILQETTSRDGYTFAPASNGLVANNLFTFSRAQLRSDVNVGPNTEPGTFEFANNLWYAHDDPARSQPVLPAPEEGAVVGRDPRLAADFGIDSTSAAYRAGTDAAGVLADGAGVCYGSPPSIGAREAR